MHPLELHLFTTDIDLACRAGAAGVDGMIVDWESKGKSARQAGYDVEINTDTLEDLARLAAASMCPVTVRINALGPQTRDEIETALSLGARGLMLPMARHPSEVARFLRLVAGRASTLVQIETFPLVQSLDGLRRLDWDRAYIGLHDLMISRGGGNLWDAVLDGTVERVFRTLSGRPVGFGGVTVIGGGDPLPFALLLHEMSRLGCRLSFLRRTFKKEIGDRDLEAEIGAVRALWQASCRRGAQAIAADHRALRDRLMVVAREPRGGRRGGIPQSSP